MVGEATTFNALLRKRWFVEMNEGYAVSTCDSSPDNNLGIG